MEFEIDLTGMTATGVKVRNVADRAPRYSRVSLELSRPQTDTYRARSVIYHERIDATAVPETNVAELGGVIGMEATAALDRFNVVVAQIRLAVRRDR